MSLIRLPSPSDSVETLGTRMGKDVVENLGRIVDGDAPSRSIVGHFVVGDDPIHAVAHEVFLYEADITPCFQNPNRVLAIGELVLDVARVFDDDDRLLGVTYTIPTEGL